ncbi:MAG: HepT-like ribonuclease domain-containing protein [Candidatus Methylomirabilales bacterium]
MNCERSQLFERLQAEAENLLGETPTLFAYGIAMPEDFPALRDVQIAAFMDPNLPPGSYFHVEIRLETLLEEMLAVPGAGVRILNETPLTFRGAVLTAGRVVYSRDEEARIAFERGVWGRYFDLRQMLGWELHPMEDAVTIRRDEMTARLGQMERCIGQLRGFEKAAAADPIQEGAGRYFLQSAITCALAVCLELITAMKLRPPRDFADIPEVLAEVGQLEPGLARELGQLIEIRNRLVLDPGTEDASLSEELPSHLTSLERFARAAQEQLGAK